MDEGVNAALVALLRADPLAAQYTVHRERQLWVVATELLAHALDRARLTFALNGVSATVESGRAGTASVRHQPSVVA